MATITHIDRIEGGYTYTFDIATPVDIFLNGTHIESDWAETTFDLYTQEFTPPPIEIAEPGATTNSKWAGRAVGVQFFTGNHAAFAVTRIEGGTPVETTYHDSIGPYTYQSVFFNFTSSDTIQVTYTVRAATKYGVNEYAITGDPVEAVVNRYFLPTQPVVEFSWNNTTRELTIR